MAISDGKGLYISIQLHICMKSKKRLTLTVDKDVIVKFREHCSKNSMKMSTKIENLIRKEIQRCGHDNQDI